MSVSHSRSRSNGGAAVQSQSGWLCHVSFQHGTPEGELCHDHSPASFPCCWIQWREHEGKGRASAEFTPWALLLRESRRYNQPPPDPLWTHLPNQRWALNSPLMQSSGSSLHWPRSESMWEREREVGTERCTSLLPQILDPLQCLGIILRNTFLSNSNTDFGLEK